MRVVLPLIAALAPLIIAPQISFSFDVIPKVIVLLAGTAIALLAWRGEWPQAGVARTVALLLVGQIIWLAVATALSRYPGLSIAGGNWRQFGFVAQFAVLLFAMLVISDCAGRPERAITYLRAIAITGLPIAIYGMLQHFGLDPLVSSTGYHAGDGPFTIVRPPSTLGHASYFGTYLIYVVFAGTALALAGHKAWRLIGICACASATVAIIFSGTRAALAGIAVGGLLLLVRVPALRTKRMLALAAAGMAALLGLSMSPAGAGIRSRIHWALEEPTGGARPLLWRDAVTMASHRPVVGFGPETFLSEFPRFQSVALSRAYPDFQHESPHNALLDTLIEQGLPGVLLFCALAGFTIYYGLRGSTLSVVLTAGLAGALVAQQFNVLTVSTAAPLYVSIALIAALGGAIMTPIRRSVRLAPQLGVALALILFAGRLAFADHELARTRDAFAKNDLAGALNHYNHQQRWSLPGSAADLYVSRELASLFQRTHDVRVKLQTWTPAFQAATRAVSTTEDRKGAFYNLAIFFATQNDPANVERCLRNSIYLAPNWFKPHWALSRLLYKEGRTQDAESEARTAVNLNGGKNAEVAETLAAIGAGTLARGQSSEHSAN